MRDPRTRKGIHANCFGSTFRNTFCLANLFGKPLWQICLATLGGKPFGQHFLVHLLGKPFWQIFWATLFGKLSGALTGQTFVANCFGKHLWQTYLANLSRLTSLGSPLWLAPLGPPLWAELFRLRSLKWAKIARPASIRIKSAPP